jgi:hypothetical protein
MLSLPPEFSYDLLLILVTQSYSLLSSLSPFSLSLSSLSLSLPLLSLSLFLSLLSLSLSFDLLPWKENSLVLGKAVGTLSCHHS